MSMDFLQMYAIAQANRDRPFKMFDWESAAGIIRERGARDAWAYVAPDDMTRGQILKDGAPVPQEESGAHLTSTWATPTLVLDDEEIPCFVMESEHRKDAGWWTDEALKILGNQAPSENG